MFPMQTNSTRTNEFPSVAVSLKPLDFRVKAGVGQPDLGEPELAHRLRAGSRHAARAGLKRSPQLTLRADASGRGRFSCVYRRITHQKSGPEVALA